MGDLFDQTSFSQMVRQRRLAARIGLRELAFKLGLAPSTLSRVESGAGTPEVETYLRLVAWLEMPLPSLRTCPSCGGAGFVGIERGIDPLGGEDNGRQG